MKLANIRKIHLVGDLHLGIKNNSVEWLQIQKDFLLDFLLTKVDEDFDEEMSQIVSMQVLTTEHNLNCIKEMKRV